MTYEIDAADNFISTPKLWQTEKHLELFSSDSTKHQQE